MITMLDKMFAMFDLMVTMFGLIKWSPCFFKLPPAMFNLMTAIFICNDHLVRLRYNCKEWKCIAGEQLLYCVGYNARKPWYIIMSNQYPSFPLSLSPYFPHFMPPLSCFIPSFHPSFSQYNPSGNCIINYNTDMYTIFFFSCSSTHVVSFMEI